MCRIKSLNTVQNLFFCGKARVVRGGRGCYNRQRANIKAYITVRFLVCVFHPCCRLCTMDGVVLWPVSDYRDSTGRLDPCVVRTIGKRLRTAIWAHTGWERWTGRDVATTNEYYGVCFLLRAALPVIILLLPPSGGTVPFQGWLLFNETRRSLLQFTICNFSINSGITFSANVL